MPPTRTAPLSRRALVAGGLSIAGAAGLAGSAGAGAQRQSRRGEFRYCLNTSTLRGQQIPITQIVDIAGQAGYQGIEPWIREIDQFVMGGGSLKDLAQGIKDRGLTV